MSARVQVREKLQNVLNVLFNVIFKVKESDWPFTWNKYRIFERREGVFLSGASSQSGSSARTRLSGAFESRILTKISLALTLK